MIEKINIQNFKSYKETDFKISPLTVLIGANASGKSNALEALRLLSWIAAGNKLSAVKYAVQEGGSVVRGRVSELGYSNEASFKFTCTAPFSRGSASPTYWDTFTIEIASTIDDELYIVDERVVGPGTTVPLYEVAERHEQVGHDLIVAYNNFARGGIKPKVACMDQQAVFIQLESSARYSTNHRTSQLVIPFVSSRLQDWLGGIHFLDPSPPSMRSYSFKSEHSLLQNGSNLSGVLFQLSEVEQKKDEVLKFISSLPEQNITDIGFIETPRGEVMLKLTETFGNQENSFDAGLLSDGTLRVLAVAAVMLTAEKGSLVVIEEIDNGIHPSRAGVLLNRIAEIAGLRELRVVISSHNPALLDALPDTAIPDVVFCYRNIQDGSSKLVRLAELEYYPEIVSQGDLGDLLTRGIIDRYAKMTSRRSNREKNKGWVEALKKASRV